MTRSHRKRWTTSSLHEAAYLVVHGLKCVAVQMTEDRIVFVFEKPKESEIWAQEFRFGTQALVDARYFLEALLQLSERCQ